MNDFGPYVKLYVNRKKELFPLIERYSGASMQNVTHGQAIQEYVNLLRTNEAFRNDANELIEQYRYSIGTLVESITGIFGGIAQKQAEKEKQDTLLYESILNGQSGSDTQKILIISGVTLVLVGLGVFLVLKMKK